MNADPEHFTLKVNVPDEKKTFVSEEHVEIDEKTNTATFCVKGVIDANNFIKEGQERTLVIHLTDSNQAIAFFVNACVRDVAAEEGLFEKSIQVFDKTKDAVFDKTKDAVEVAATFYKETLFKPRDSQNDNAPAEQDAKGVIPQKTVPVIHFTLRKITTPEIGYTVNGNVLEKMPVHE
jgi:hypothetical protein